MSKPWESAYCPQTLEPQWHRAWEQAGAFAPRADGDKFYVLEMFPYPSGDLHMGHVRNYAIGDVFARFARMCGKNVLHPMGWDSFGLPAENQAIAEKVAPQVRTPQNIARMRAQAVRLGLGYDWSRELATHLPAYYGWTQWLFLQLYHKGLVYRRRSTVNFCPGCNTVLANEQVNDDNVCWRGHPGVEPRQVREWAFRITAYAEELLADLSKLGHWPQRIVTQQHNWLGKSSGAQLHFAVRKPDFPRLEIFTTRPETLYGCTYLVLAPEHPAVAALTTATQRHQVDAFCAQMRGLDRVARFAEGGDKHGVFTGAYAVHPLTHQNLPVWLANFVLADYGSGAVMGVPAHDARDFDFARQYGLPMRVAVASQDVDAPPSLPFLEPGILVDSGPFTGQPSDKARVNIIAHAQAHGFGSLAVRWHLRDWGFSRQRYWGTPIPVVYCERCECVPLEPKALPVVLPDFESIELDGRGGPPLGKLPTFVDTTCPKCGQRARREVETMDTFVDSAWYFARFLSSGAPSEPFSNAAARHWLPIDVYVGGPEHAVMHLLYFRFFTKAMRDLGLLDVAEPVRRLMTQGMINARAYRCVTHGYVAPHTVMHQGASPRCPNCQQDLLVTTEKMSKSKRNGIDPLALIDKYGADTTRLYTLFAAPPEKDLEWSSEGVEGVYRFLNRLWRIFMAQAQRVQQVAPATAMAGLSAPSAQARRALHRTLAKVHDELSSRNHFNTAVAAMMEMCNVFYELKMHESACEVTPAVSKECLLVVAQMLSPLAPHIAETFWQHSGGQGFVGHSLFPAADPQALLEPTVLLAIQINGKLRGQMQVPFDMDAPQAALLARADANVARHLEGKVIRREIFIPNRLLNFVVSC